MGQHFGNLLSISGFRGIGHGKGRENPGEGGCIMCPDQRIGAIVGRGRVNRSFGQDFGLVLLNVAAQELHLDIVGQRPDRQFAKAIILVQIMAAKLVLLDPLVR